MAAPQDLRSTGDRMERLLADLRAGLEPRAYERVEDLLRLVTDLYGAALARIVEVAEDGACPGLRSLLAGDDLVASLMLVHGLHPESVEVRVEAALASVRPLLAQHGGGVELLAVDPAASAVLLRLVGSCDGCPSSSVTLRHAVEEAVIAAAPEISRIDVEEGRGDAGATRVELGPRRQPTYDGCPSEGDAHPSVRAGAEAVT